MGQQAFAGVPDQLPLGRDSMAWRINSEPSAILGGGRAVLMQVADPGVGAGVEQHSSFASDPWGRLFRTMDVMSKLGFATPEQSARQQRLLDKMHRRVKGTIDDGSTYSAHDTDLQLWVWATLVETALLMYEIVVQPITHAEREQYYTEQKLIAYGCGVPRGACPETWADFDRYVAGVIANDLRVTDSARRVAAAAMVPPLPGVVGGLVGVPNRLVTVGLLPPSLREQFGFSWSANDRRHLSQWFAMNRGVTRICPTPVRRLPAQVAIARKGPMRVPWLQKRGAEITARNLAKAGFQV